MYYTYILFSKKDRKLYYGYTPNLKERFIKHERGEVQSTVYRRPLILIYYESFLIKKDAIAREKYFKTAPGRKYIKRHLKHTLAGLAHR